MSSDGTPTVEHLLRDLAPQVLAAVARRYADFAAAEDAVQEALIAAAAQWPASGPPANPRGWLYHVALRRLTDHVRSETARRRREDAVAGDVWAEWAFVAPADGGLEPERDDTLLLLFMCCHPSLTPASAIALTLRAVGGLTTAEIAAAFLVPEATMAQRISRAKQTIRASGVAFAAPDDRDLEARLQLVAQTLYLIFTEGYTSTGGDSLDRPDLAREAIRLARLLRDARPEDPEAGGLLALMLLTDARRAARSDATGALVPLDEQDRSLWDRSAIGEGIAVLSSALERGAAGPYQLQAAIAAVHDEASSTDATDWPQILALYDVLLSTGDNPMVALNRAIAVSMVHGPAAALGIVETLAADARLRGHHRVDAVRAHLHERLGEHAVAARWFLSASDKTASIAERDYLRVKAARAEGSARGTTRRPLDAREE